MTVVATSGRRIGVVTGLGDGMLRIRIIGTRSGEMWLQAAAIFTVEDETVTLICEEDGLHRYRAEPV